MSFSELGLGPDLLRAIADAGYIEPTPIQDQVVPHVLRGRDVLGCAQTGTGKTAAFTLPMIDILAAGRAKARMPRSLILSPTRELATQTAEQFETLGKYHKLTKALLIGGVSMDDQIRLLDRGVDVLIATPGRLLDHFGSGRILLTDIKILVIDEADRMLDMGFMPDVEKIVGLLPKIRQTLLFSATLPPEIKRLGGQFLINPKEFSIASTASAATLVTQGLAIVDTMDKREALRRLIRAEAVRNAIIFCNRKKDVDILYKSLKKHGFDAAAIHGDMHQSSRTDTLESFKRGEISLLVASDVAARGLDIFDMSHVFNFDVPTHPEDYVHRIGRTGRAGRSGRALTLAAPEDGGFVQAIEKLINNSIPRIEVPGMDSLSLEESDGRARRRGGRGRTGAKSGTRAPQSRRAERRPAEPRSAEPQHVEQRLTERPQPHRTERRPTPSSAPEPKAEPIRQHTLDDRPPRPQPPAERLPHKPDDERRVVGMGAHVPAFMLRAPRSNRGTGA